MAQPNLTISAMYKTILNSALDMKIASIKRAKNSEKSPRFQEVYDLEMRETLEVQNWVNSAKIAD